MISKIDYFNQIMQTRLSVIKRQSNGGRYNTLWLHARNNTVSSQKYKLETTYENSYKWEDLYLKIREKLEKEDEELALSLAHAWKSAKEMLV